MLITGTHFNYYQICHRKLWLFANGIHLESSSELVYEGKLLHETSYSQRSNKYKEIAIDGIKIDYFDHKNKVVHEIKKSSKHEKAHEWQVKYYLYVLKQHGIDNATGLLEYPKQHATKEVFLTIPDISIISEIIIHIENIVTQNLCPDKIPQSKCWNCSYFDFCYSEE